MLTTALRNPLHIQSGAGSRPAAIYVALHLPELPEAFTLRLERGLIAVLFVGGLVFAGLGLSGKPEPEVVIETCSFAAALLLVAAEHRRVRRTKRSAAVTNIAKEMERNADALYAKEWLIGADEVEKEATDVRRGLRLYYPHVATVATGGALLGDALDARRDAPLVAQLQLWQQSAEAFNTRVTMAQLLLFFLPRDKDSMLERLEIHVTIATKTVSKQRDELAAVVNALEALYADRELKTTLSASIAKVREVLKQRKAADQSADALRKYLARSLAATTVGQGPSPLSDSAQ